MRKEPIGIDEVIHALLGQKETREDMLRRVYSDLLHAQVERAVGDMFGERTKSPGYGDLKVREAHAFEEEIDSAVHAYVDGNGFFEWFGKHEFHIEEIRKFTTDQAIRVTQATLEDASTKPGKMARAANDELVEFAHEQAVEIVEDVVNEMGILSLIRRRSSEQ